MPRLLSSAAAAAPAEACALEYRGFLHAFVQIARCEGLRGLYKGLLPSLLLVSDSVRMWSRSGGDGLKESGSFTRSQPFSVCGSLPINEQHLVVMLPQHKAACAGIWLLTSLPLCWLLQVSHGAIQFAVYEELKHAAEGVSLQRFTGSLDRLLGSGSSSSSSSSSSDSSGSSGRHQTKVRELTPAEITACGALSKLAASVATYPSQVS